LVLRAAERDASNEIGMIPFHALPRRRLSANQDRRHRTYRRFDQDRLRRRKAHLAANEDEQTVERLDPGAKIRGVMQAQDKPRAERGDELHS